MYNLKEWAHKIKEYSGKNAYSRLQWLMGKKKNDYVTADFIESAKRALEIEHKATIAFLDNEKKKVK